ncbi:MAG: hypothetical protein AAF664_26390, partial [Planctomycetota bacterium]
MAQPTDSRSEADTANEPNLEKQEGSDPTESVSTTVEFVGGAESTQTSRTKKLLLFVGVPILVAVGVISLCLQAMYPVDRNAASYEAPVAKPPTPAELAEAAAKALFLKRTEKKPATFDLLMQDENKDLFESLRPTDEAVVMALQTTQERLLREDPHLAKAMRDPMGTPLVGIAGPTLADDICEQAFPWFEDAITRLHNRRPDLAYPELAESIRRCWYAFWLSETASQHDREIIRGSGRSGQFDPLALYVYHLGDSNRNSREATVERLAKTIGSADVGPHMRVQILSEVIAWRGYISDELWLDSVLEFFEATADSWSLLASEENDPGLEYIMLRSVEFAFGKLNGWCRVELLRHLVEGKAPQWVQQYFAGYILYDAAWHHRGTGFIYEIEPDDYAKFSSLISQATDLMVIAWSLRPIHVQLPRMLLACEMTAGETGLSTSEWFRHGIARMLNSQSLHEAMAIASLPRWGGSKRQLLQLAQLCVDAGDFRYGTPRMSEYYLDWYMQDQSKRTPIDQRATDWAKSLV